MSKLTLLTIRFRLIIKLSLIILYSFIFVNPVFADVSSIKACDNPIVQVEPIDRSRSGYDGPLLSDDKKARFTIDVNRAANESNSKITKWYMEWQCGVSLGIGPLQKQVNFQKNEAQNSPADRNIFSDLDNSGTLVNRCEFDPSNNPIRIRVKAVTNSQEVDWCDATYLVADADKLCKLNLTPSTNIVPGKNLTVSGTDLTQDGKFILLFDNQPIWTNKLTLGTPLGATIDFNKINLNSPSTPTFDGYQIDQQYLTRGEHQISLNRITRNLLNSNFLTGRSVNDLIEQTPLCTISFTVGDAANPGSIKSTTGGDLTTSSSGTACIGTECTLSGGSRTNCSNGIDTAIGCIQTDPVNLTKDLLRFVIAISGGIAFLLMLIGAFGMITSAGNPDNLAASRDRFVKAIEGLLFVIFAVLLMKIIGVDILGLGTYLGF